MTEQGKYSDALSLLRKADLRPTRQRLALCNLLFDGKDRHVTAETLHGEAASAGVGVSLATVYNTLHQFTAVGLLRQVVVDGARTYFDTNTTEHQHYFIESDGSLLDIPGTGVDIDAFKDLPDGMKVESVEVVVRLKPADL